MKNMPSVMKEMPNGVKRPIPEKQMQKERQLTSVSGLDFISPAAVPVPPVAFQRFFQDSMRVQDQAGIRMTSLSGDGKDQGSSVGKTELSLLSDQQGLLSLAGTKSRLEKGRLISASGVKGQTRKKISVEGPLNASQNVAISSQNISMVDNNSEPVSRPPRENTESLAQQQHVAGKAQDRLRSGLRRTGECSVVSREEDGPSRDAVMKTESLLNVSSIGIIATEPLSLGPVNESGVLSPAPQHGSGKTHENLRSGLRRTGGYSVVPGQKGGPSNDAAIKTSSLLNASSIGIIATEPLSLRPVNESGVLIPVPQQHASGKAQDHLRSGLLRTGECSVVPGAKAGASKDEAVIIETDGNTKMEHVANVDDVPGRNQSVEMINDQENSGPSEGSTLLSTLRVGPGKRAQTVSGVKTTSLLNTLSVEEIATASPSLEFVKNESGVLSGSELQRIFVKQHDHLQSSFRYTDGYSAFSEEKGGSIRSVAIVETDGNAKTGLPDDIADVTGSVHGVDARYDNEHMRHVHESPLHSLLRDGSGKYARAVPVSKTSILSTNAAVPAADAELILVESDGEKGILSAGEPYNVSEKTRNHVRSDSHCTDNNSTIRGGKGGQGKSAAILEMEGNAKLVHADDVDAAIRSGDHGADIARNEENKGSTDSSPLVSLVKDNFDGHLRRAVVVEKASLLSTAPAPAVPAVDPASTSGSSDNGEAILSPGRQALLMAEVIDAARPLMQQDGGRIRISLSPPSLGALEIDVRVKKEGVELFVVANNADVQQTLCSHIDQLRKALAEQGLNMDRFQVVVGDRSDGQQGRDPRQEGMSGGHRDAWSDKGYSAGFDEDTMNDKTGTGAFSGSYPSVGVINLFI